MAMPLSSYLRPPERPPGFFRSQLESLAAAYDTLETENNELRQALTLARSLREEEKERRNEQKSEADFELDMSIVPAFNEESAHSMAPTSGSVDNGMTVPAHVHLRNDETQPVPGNGRSTTSSRTPSGKVAVVLEEREARSSTAQQRESLARVDSVNFKRSRRNPKRMSLISSMMDATGRGSFRMSGMQRPPIFLDADTMKENVRNQMASKNQYKPEDFYKDTGFCQAVARSGAFESITLLVIAINAIWIWIDTDYNKHDVLIQADPIFQIVENLFCAYFSFEIVVRFFAFARKLMSLHDAWFVFDLILVIMMVMETWVLSIILLSLPASNRSSDPLGSVGLLSMVRMLRLFRMARMVRLLRAIPEFMILIKAIGAALRSVFFCLALLCIFLYSFGIALTQLLKDSSIGRQKFGSVVASMHTLFLNATLLDSIEKLMKAVIEDAQSPAACFVIYVFILVGGITIMNMLIGVLCEVVTCVAATEREVIAVQSVRTTLQRIVDMGVDADGDGRISKGEFAEMLQTKECVQALQDIGVDAVGLVDVADTIFQNSAEDEHYEKTLSFDEFMGVILEMRGSNKATVKDIVDLRKFVAQTLAKSEMRTERLYKKMTTAPLPEGLLKLCTTEWHAQRSSHQLSIGAGTGSELTEGGACASRAQSRILSRGGEVIGSPVEARANDKLTTGVPETATDVVDVRTSSARREFGNGHHSVAPVSEVPEWFDELDLADWDETSGKTKSFV